MYESKPPTYDPIKGGQVADHYRADLLPMRALLQISHLLKEGSKRHQDENPEQPRWHKTEVREHLNRALCHIMAHMIGDVSENHLLHAATRMLFALECHQLQEI